jgi:hypothetical protein
VQCSIHALGAGQPRNRSIPGRRKRFFSLPKCPDRLCVPPSLLFDERQYVFPGSKAAERLVADHSPPCSAKVKSEWSYTSSTTYALMLCTGTTVTSHILSYHLPSLGQLVGRPQNKTKQKKTQSWYYFQQHSLITAANVTNSMEQSPPA